MRGKESQQRRKQSRDREKTGNLGTLKPLERGMGAPKEERSDPPGGTVGEVQPCLSIVGVAMGFESPCKGAWAPQGDPPGGQSLWGVANRHAKTTNNKQGRKPQNQTHKKTPKRKKREERDRMKSGHWR